MNEEDFPALYHAADSASNQSQALLLRSYKLNAGLLIAGALAALISATETWLAIVSLLLFLGSLVVYFAARYQKLQGNWYQARALAESIKTATWRLMMSADPFAQADTERNLEGFHNLLKELLVDNRGIGQHLSGDRSTGDQVTARMRDQLTAPFKDKKQFYLEHRIDDQLSWYARRAKENQRASKWFSGLLILAYGISILLLCVRIAAPATPHLPIGVFAVLASSIIGWTQLRRYDELASAYGLTAHEVGIIKSRFGGVADASGLGEFVGDAENAFSREHTQWAARRDH